MEDHSQEHREMIARLFDEVWNKGNADAAGEFYAQGDYLESVKDLARALHTAFPDYHATINQMVVEGDNVAIHWTVTGTHQGEWQGVAATGRPVTIEGMDFVHVSEGKIVDEQSMVDMGGMMEQLTADTQP